MYRLKEIILLSSIPAVMLLMTFTACNTSKRSSSPNIVTEETAPRPGIIDAPADIPGDSTVTDVAIPGEDDIIPEDPLDEIPEVGLPDEGGEDIPFDEILEYDPLDGEDIPFDDEPVPTDGETPVTEEDDTNGAGMGDGETVTVTPPAETQSSENEVPDPEDEENEEAPAAKSDEGPKILEYYADIQRPLKVGDSTVTYLRGNVILYHNGAVITCDSAVRYGPNRMDVFQRVVINKGTTYVYGDRAVYDGDINRASVYSRIIKVVDEDAVLYTYKFRFNTLDNIGEYDGGGTLSQNENLLESVRGYYYADDREIIAVDQVELRNDEYRMTSDSVKYNFDTEIAEFYTTTHIWNDKGEILIADKGRFNNANSSYYFTENSYVLNDDYEIMSDSIDYNSETGDAILRRDIQIKDEENNTYAFGDYGEYWGETENGMLTRDPSLVSWEAEQPDTVYMRSDSMFFFTYPRDHVFFPADDDGSSGRDEVSLEELLSGPDEPPGGDDDEGEEDAGDSQATGTEPDDTGDSSFDKEMDDILGIAGREDTEAEEDSQRMAAGEELPPPPQTEPGLTKKEEKAARNEQKKLERLERKADRQARIAEKKGIEIHIHDDHDHDHDHEVHTHDNGHGHDEEGEPATVTGAAELPDYLDAVAGIDAIELIHGDSLSLTGFTSPDGEPGPDGEITEQDSVQRVFIGLWDVRIYRDDFQAVCDSLMGFSIDSTLHMFKDPVLWSDQNQVTADIIILYTKDEQVYKAEYKGSPFMSAEVVKDEYYNQIKGRYMESWFRDNDIYRHDVIGNAKTHYYDQDEETGDVVGFMDVESADLTFLIDERQIEEIIWRVDPDYDMYPMDKIPATLDQRLEGFKWEIHRRPMTKEDVFNRTIRPSRRQIVLAIPQPQFPLTDSIHEDRERMIREGLWRERNDVLSQDTLDFIRSVEMKYEDE